MPERESLAALPGPSLGDRAIEALRPARNEVDPRRPYAFVVEDEVQADGCVEPVAVLFLTNRECPFRCLMCDLWKNTTEASVAAGDIPAQIDFALRRLAPARHVKLYNSGNFFDAQAIPPGDHGAIADRVAGFRTVIVENHPRLCTTRVLEFRDRLPASSRLEVALGLECAHPEVLRRLNKRMDLDDFRRACAFLVENDIAVRTFVLLRPPFLSEDEGVEWALRSLEFAFDCGVECAAVVPTRSGNGALELLHAQGWFEEPSLESLTVVLTEGLRRGGGRVLADLWDLDRFRCDGDRAALVARLEQMNRSQVPMPSP